jgi:small multidrug resistance pump
MKSWLFLGVAIFCEVVATSSLKASQEFSRVIPSIVVVIGYVGAFYFLSLALRTIPVGIAYAIFSCNYRYFINTLWRNCIKYFF